MCMTLVSISGVAAGYSFCTFFLLVVMCRSFKLQSINIIYSSVIAVHNELSEACLNWSLLVVICFRYLLKIGLVSRAMFKTL